MYQPINVELATRIGITSAICAQCLYDGIQGAFAADIEEAKGREWVRMGSRQLTLLIPYLTPHSAKGALRRLVKGGIVCTADLNDSPFDHTYWYSFTSYGECLMAATGSEED
jgi:hypothetical protein